MDQVTLYTWVMLNVSNFCRLPGTSTDNNENQCAHFVSHVLGWRCVLNLDNVFRRCRNFRNYAQLREDERRTTGGLVYVCQHPATVRNGRCVAMPGTNRHVGFYVNGLVWHYENDTAYEKVVTYPMNGGLPGSRFFNRYGPGCQHWISDLPRGSTLHPAPRQP